MQDIQGGTGRDSVEELRFQTQIIKTITDNTTSSLFMMDSRGYPTFMNKAAERLTGYTLNEIRDRPLHYAIHYMRPDGSFYPMHECPLDNSSAKLVPMQNQEEVFVDKFGRLFPVMWSVAPLERDGRTVGAVIEFRDVTEEKERERERMEAKVSAEQEEVRRQEAEMHRVRMSEFVDLICHEMRNPLHGIAANNMFLRELINRSHDVSLQEESKDLLSSIEECANHQGRVINSVLELSRLEAGKVELDPSTMSLNTALRNCVDMCRPKFLECKLQCELLLPNGDDVIVHLDSTRLKQIVLNLLTNGIKFTPPNGKITVRLDVTERNSDHVVAEISVEDTGLGMSADEMGMLFKRFSQVNKAVSNKYGGSGLGLSICDQLVRLMHGSIAVNSEKGRGTRFAVRLPCPVPSNASSLAFVAQLATSPVAMSVNSRKAAAGQLADTIKDQAFERILIAEDNPINQRVLAKFLTKLGYAFDLVEDGAQAVQAVCSHDKHYDLVFMDIEMPTMNGLQATRVIREHESRFCQNGDRARCRCVIVALSGNAMKEHMERGREAGMDDYLVKPCRIEEINACIAKWETVVNQERFRTVDVVN
jgi:PAS domain S-box-containing protein